ncbi:uncharacterized protein AMSG_07617 [Thecamonas trahens ATCC 50062]|uniref:Uncharacterized protein n=1 Tax=Thecamonas trahens ATCC 50062 TaxID=461836 RepID=A0A0L0DGU7_THETB|nr:hypothetical protein AMSG_07617 [Thecamonas trahens ATCC 50062]KNC51425.1 hypothetical protein AMSG_07617 [Thecamonas trahens ATCC 50062]|eukprot:XP_013756089.1 hypothetical protein AMSG_07617 [Thecamonas trahens ATCC 50062]
MGRRAARRKTKYESLTKHARELQSQLASQSLGPIALQNLGFATSLPPPPTQLLPLTRMPQTEDAVRGIAPLAETGPGQSEISAKELQDEMAKLQMMQKMFTCQYRQRVLLDSQMMLELGRPQSHLAQLAPPPLPISLTAVPPQFMSGPCTLTPVQKAAMLKHLQALQAQQNSEMERELVHMYEMRTAHLEKHVQMREQMRELGISNVAAEQLSTPTPMSFDSPAPSGSNPFAITSSTPTNAAAEAAAPGDDIPASRGATTSGSPMAVSAVASPSLSSLPSLDTWNESSLRSLPTPGVNGDVSAHSFASLDSSGLFAPSGAAAMDLGGSSAVADAYLNILQGTSNRAENW